MFSYNKLGNKYTYLSMGIGHRVDSIVGYGIGYVVKSVNHQSVSLNYIKV